MHRGTISKVGSEPVPSTFTRFVTFTFPVGELPAQLCKLTKLTHLDVSSNQLTGPLSTHTERFDRCD